MNLVVLSGLLHDAPQSRQTRDGNGCYALALVTNSHGNPIPVLVWPTRDDGGHYDTVMRGKAQDPIELVGLLKATGEGAKARTYVHVDSTPSCRLMLVQRQS